MVRMGMLQRVNICLQFSNYILHTICDLCKMFKNML